MERYLGVYLTLNCQFIVPEELVDSCINNMVRMKKLRARRMTILTAYIRPKLLYKLAISTCAHLAT